MAGQSIVQIQPLGFPWQTVDPFLFCVWHDDAYPKGNAQFGPAASLAGRNLGQDFAGTDGWRMYHGLAVPGFPAHPHRGFETVTIVRQGLIDHSDSLGAGARFGGGDVQWLTAGRGIVHAEMFPLLDSTAPNPLELFQIWLNLPARSKMAAPHFTMFWAEQIPHRVWTDADGRSTEVVCIAGRLDDAGGATPPLPSARPPTSAPSPSSARSAPSAIPPPPPQPPQPPQPPPDSSAAQPGSDLAIWTITLAPGARWTLPAAAGAGTRRRVYFFKGASLVIDGHPVDGHAAIELQAQQASQWVNGPQTSELLLLQGRPIGEPVAQYGPFVMNTQHELQQAFDDYRRTEFGGWPWPDTAPVHGAERQRFARHADGRVETLPGQVPRGAPA